MDRDRRGSGAPDDRGIGADTGSQWNEDANDYAGADSRSAVRQDNSASDTSGSSRPEDLGSTGWGTGTGLTAGGTDTALGEDDDISDGGLPGPAAGSGTTGGTSSGSIG